MGEAGGRELGGKRHEGGGERGNNIEKDLGNTKEMLQEKKISD